MTPYYQRDNITIYCGEASEVLSHFDLGSIDLTVTSPPYDNLRTYNGYVFDFEAIAGQLWRVTTAGGVVVWVVGDATVDGSETCTSDIQKLHFRGLGFNVWDTMIYQTSKAPLNDRRYQQCFEYMFIFSKEQPKTVNLIRDKSLNAGDTDVSKKGHRDGNNLKQRFHSNPYKAEKTRDNIWYFATGHNCSTLDKEAFNHPAIFPEALARDHIISWSNPGDLVCDPMLGSGTTAKMAQQLRRRFVGCDISEDYCKIAVERLRQSSFFSLPNREPVAQPEQVSLF